MSLINKIETAKIIGIGEEGVTTLDTIADKVRETMDIEKIFPHQDVDKDYVRELLDGVDVLFLTYNSEDKASLQIVNAIGYMTDERRVLSIGLDVATKENKDNVNLNREFKLNKDTENNLINLLNMMLDSISDECTISIDLTDLKEVLATDKAIKYSYGEFSKTESKESIAAVLKENLVSLGEEFTDEKGIIIIEIGQNSDEHNMLVAVNELLEKLQENIENTNDRIFSLYVRENLDDKIKVGLIYN